MQIVQPLIVIFCFCALALSAPTANAEDDGDCPSSETGATLGKECA